MLTVCLDTESYWDDDVSVVPLGYDRYARHPKTDLYLVSVCDGKEAWAGHPRDFNWDALNGVRVLSHNKAHDEEMVLAGWEVGRLPKFTPTEWQCTSNLSSWLWNVRSLQEACKIGLNVDLSKAVRDRTKGKTVEDMVREGWYDEVVEYGRKDAIYPLELWNRFSDKWPEVERRLSNLTIEQGRYGVAIDALKLVHYIEVLQRVIFTAQNNLPWVKRGRLPGSFIGIAEECRASDIPPQPVKAHDEEAAEEWEETYAPRFAWVMALRNLRKAKKTLAFLETMRLRLREDCTMAFALKYSGAVTKRWAGDGGLSLHNLPKSPFFVREDYMFELRKKEMMQLDELFDAGKELPGVKEVIDIRGLIVARPGCKLAPTDLSQIEPRAQNFAVGNHELLSRISKGMAIYEAHARDSMHWKGGVLKVENKSEYARAKVRVLSFGYGSGWKKAIVAALKEKVDLTIGDKEYAKKAAFDGLIHRRAGSPGKYYYHSLPGGPYHPDTGRVEGWTPPANWAEFTRKYPHQPDSNCQTEDVIFVQKENKRTGRKSLEVQTVYGQRARAEITDFRATNPLIVGMWKTLQEQLELSVGGDFHLELPSGRCLVYPDVKSSIKKVKDEETGEMVERRCLTYRVGFKRKITYGSKLAENYTQALARDVFAHNMLLCDDAGIRTLFHVHDEIVPEVPEDFDTKIITKLMSVTPAWLAGCPIAAETKETKRYLK